MEAVKHVVLCIPASVRAPSEQYLFLRGRFSAVLVICSRELKTGPESFFIPHKTLDRHMLWLQGYKREPGRENTANIPQFFFLCHCYDYHLCCFPGKQGTLNRTYFESILCRRDEHRLGHMYF